MKLSVIIPICALQNRQSYSQLPGDSKVSSVKIVPPRKTGKGRGKGETVHPPEDNKVEVTSIKERTLNTPEILKAFCVQFVRLNGVLFTRTTYFHALENER
ncbi:hypothetical protein IFM89_016981 [Coptis chinensis]|uniref:Uncharacterized protein n=1 Tax=Coptis chinensis TaxID=261450 RepID=A0A835HVC2_9MAGN|nr:hypothetical protein IFM89_016981 [Coptis chinensis]